MKEKILETFKALGFKLEDLEKLGYGFEYERKHFILTISDDEDFLYIAIPAVMELDENNAVSSYQLMEALNRKIKCVKAYVILERIWLFYERELFEEDDLQQIVVHMIVHLDAAYDYIWSAVDDLEDSASGDSEATEITEKEDSE